jgi:methionyl aminopeptidase
MNLTIKTAQDQEKMRIAGRLAASVLDMIEPFVKPGVTTQELDQRCHDFIVEELRSIPANLGYRGFPKTVCTSVNHVVCHGIPGDRRLKNGDIVNIDVTVIRDGFHGDTSRMYFAGTPPVLARRLSETCLEAMWRGIRVVRPGAHLGDIGHAIQTYAESQNFSVVREYCGHGIGRVYHEDPQVLHYGKPDTGLELVEGMTFTIEPMINAGRRDVRLLNDGWTVVTADQSLSAQWEHTILVTRTGYEVLTLSAADLAARTAAEREAAAATSSLVPASATVPAAVPTAASVSAAPAAAAATS